MTYLLFPPHFTPLLSLSHSIMSEQPKAVCGIAYDLVQRLAPIVRQIDFALDWMELEAGKALYRQGDDANAAYIILNGRVRSVVRRSDGKKQLVDEFGRGETIGVVSTIYFQGVWPDHPPKLC